MGRPLLALASAGMLLSGCAPGLIYAESRRSSKATVGATMAAQRPGLLPKAGGECLIKGMTLAEILILPNSPMAKKPAELDHFVTGVSARPGVSACLEAATIGATPKAP